VTQTVQRGARGKEAPIDPGSHYWMEVNIDSIQEGLIEIQTPQDYRKNEQHGFEIEWIDFYR
jgi:hypothetical protein